MEAGRLTTAPGRPHGLKEEVAEGDGSDHGEPGAPVAKPSWVQRRLHGQGLSGQVLVPTVKPWLSGGPYQT